MKIQTKRLSTFLLASGLCFTMLYTPCYANEIKVSATTMTQENTTTETTTSSETTTEATTEHNSTSNTQNTNTTTHQTTETKKQTKKSKKKSTKKKKSKKEDKKKEKKKKSKKKKATTNNSISSKIPYQTQTLKDGNGNTVVYYNQGDAAWRSAGLSIGSAGCGPTSMAICISTLTGKKVTPIDTTSYISGLGLYSSAGSVHSAIPTMAKHWNLTCEPLGSSESAIRTALKENKLVVALMGPGFFTRGGHFIVLTSIDENDNVTVADCGKRARCNYKYTLRSIIGESKAASAGGPFWAISNPNQKERLSTLDGSKDKKKENKKKTTPKVKIMQSISVKEDVEFQAWNPEGMIQTSHPVQVGIQRDKIVALTQ